MHAFILRGSNGPDIPVLVSASNKSSPNTHHHSLRGTVSTLVVGLKYGGILKHLTQNGELQRSDWFWLLSLWSLLNILVLASVHSVIVGTYWFWLLSLWSLLSKLVLASVHSIIVETYWFWLLSLWSLLSILVLASVHSVIVGTYWFWLVPLVTVEHTGSGFCPFGHC